MTSKECRLHIIGSVSEKLQASQMDAIDLACMDTCFHHIESLDYQTILLDLQTYSTNLVLVDIESLITLIDNYNYIPNAQTVLISFKKANPELVNYLHKLSGIRYVIGATLPAMLRPILAAIMEHVVSDTVKGLVSKIERNNEVQFWEHRLRSSSERVYCQQQVVQFFRDVLALNNTNVAPGTAMYPKLFGDVLDELLMNAIWDANKSRSHDNRSVSVDLGESENVTVKAQFDGVNLSLTVSDSQGSFPVSAIIKPIKFILGFKDLIVNEDDGGAGLGIYLILQKAAIISIEVDSGVSTRVSVLLRCDQNLRETQKRPRTILFMERHNQTDIKS